MTHPDAKNAVEAHFLFTAESLNRMEEYNRACESIVVDAAWSIAERRGSDRVVLADVEAAIAEIEGSESDEMPSPAKPFNATAAEAVCPGCGLPEIHKMCPRWGTEVYMNPQPPDWGKPIIAPAPLTDFGSGEISATEEGWLKEAIAAGESPTPAPPAEVGESIEIARECLRQIWQTIDSGGRSLGRSREGAWCEVAMALIQSTGKYRNLADNNPEEFMEMALRAKQDAISGIAPAPPAAHEQIALTTIDDAFREAADVEAEVPITAGLRADLAASQSRVKELEEQIVHWQVKAKCYGDIVHGCSPALEAAGFPVDAHRSDGAVGGIKRSVEALVAKFEADLNAKGAEIERLKSQQSSEEAVAVRDSPIDALESDLAAAREENGRYIKLRDASVAMGSWVSASLSDESCSSYRQARENFIDAVHPFAFPENIPPVLPAENTVEPTTTASTGESEEHEWEYDQVYQGIPIQQVCKKCRRFRDERTEGKPCSPPIDLATERLVPGETRADRYKNSQVHVPRRGDIVKNPEAPLYGDTGGYEHPATCCVTAVENYASGKVVVNFSDPPLVEDWWDVSDLEFVTESGGAS